MKIVLSLMLALGCFSVPSTWAKSPLVAVDFQTPRSHNQQSIQQLLDSDDGIRPLITLLNDSFKAPEGGAIALIFSADKDDVAHGPYYDLDARRIVVPYAFVEEVARRFEAADYEKQSGVAVETATVDAVLHTILHEMAHAMIAVYDLPVVGKEEDAADSLATFILSEQFENGQEIAISAADLFDLERGSDKLEEADYWGEHSLDAQRFYSTLCHVYGSNPDKYAKLLDELDIDENRQALCIEEYQKLADSWTQLLSTWLKNPH